MTTPLIHGDPDRVGSYELVARLGVGGMGEVFLGRSLGGRLVAVKLVRAELAADTGFRRRFTDEVTAARKVGGFYTAQVVDAAPDGNPAWLATAYIPGLSLQQAVTEHGPLPAASAAMLGAGLAEGLAAVHAQELVHRDLKPANVILAPDGPRLIDFGIARALDATSYTQTHTVLGTAAFMSPEQATGDTEIGPASDIFSLGCVLTFAATGQSPFGTGPPHAIGYRIVHNAPDLGELSGVSPGLADLVARCLAKEPAERPALTSVLAELAALARDRQGDQTRWLPDDLTETIAQRATDVLHGTSVLSPDEASDAPTPAAAESVDESLPTDQHSGAGADPAGQQPPSRSGVDEKPGRPAKRAPRRPLIGKPPSRRAYASALISAGLLVFAIPALLSAQGREQLAAFLGAAVRLESSAVAGVLFCAVSAYLNTRHLNWLASPVADRSGATAVISLRAAGAVIGFVTPVPAFQGLGGLFSVMLGPESDDDATFVAAALLVIASLVVALVLCRKAGRNGTWQAYASAMTSLLLFLLALRSLNALVSYSDSDVFAAFAESLESFLDQAPEVAVILMLAECCAGLYLYMEQAQRLVGSTGNRLGATVTTACTLVAGVIGAVVPFLAVSGTNDVLDRFVSGDALPWLSGLSVAILLALGIGWHREAEKTRPR